MCVCVCVSFNIAIKIDRWQYTFSCFPAVWIHFLQGQPPEPRASHASATLGHKGYICGGLVRTLNLDLSNAFFSFTKQTLVQRCYHKIAKEIPLIYGAVASGQRARWEAIAFDAVDPSWNPPLTSTHSSPFSIANQQTSIYHYVYHSPYYTHKLKKTPL